MYIKAACSPPPVKVPQLVAGEMGGHQVGLPYAARAMLRTLGLAADGVDAPQAASTVTKSTDSAAPGQERFEGR